MADTRTVETALQEVEVDLIQVIQSTKDSAMLDHLTKALAETRKARVILEE